MSIIAIFLFPGLKMETIKCFRLSNKYECVLCIVIISFLKQSKLGEDTKVMAGAVKGEIWCKMDLGYV